MKKLVDMLQLLRPFTLTVSVYLYAIICMAHGPAHERIASLTKQIEKNPFDANLYIDRAGFYKIDANFDLSYADYAKARSLDSSITNMDYMLAELFYEFDYYHSALASISDYQKRNINIAETYLFKAKVFDKLFESDSALYYSEAAYPYQGKPSTHYFVTVKEYALFADKTDYTKARYWLEEGKRKMPYDLVIQEEYVKLALSFEDYKTAETLCIEQIAKLKRKEQWQYMLGNVYLQQGDKIHAQEQFEMASGSIEKLPRHHKSTSYIVKLKSDIELKQEQLKS